MLCRAAGMSQHLRIRVKQDQMDCTTSAARYNMAAPASMDKLDDMREPLRVRRLEELGVSVDQ
jgi:hypothetical protein